MLVAPAPLITPPPARAIAPNSVLPSDPFTPIPHTSPLFPVGTAARSWQDVAARKAGIDLTTWHPERGLDANKTAVWNVYDYYRRSQIEHPNMKWMGMAYSMSPTFAAAFSDLAAVNRMIAGVERGLDNLPAPVRDAARGAFELAGGMPLRIAKDLEGRFLGMQRAIFLDMGMQHEAYLGGGIDALRTLHREGAVDDIGLKSWEHIDEGIRTHDRSKLLSGIEGLVWIEQMEILTPFYDGMRALTPLSPFVTRVLTSIGEPALPGAGTPTDVMPVKVGPIALPFSSMDISKARDRWQYIAQEGWPAFQELEQQPEAYRELLSKTLDERIEEGGYRRLPDYPSMMDFARAFGDAVAGD